ncbi:MAG: hypothetical protein HKN29_09460 [Rhodothermales bacterium]|nr:hypothetical protein [Rhodothermales bacterium]
MPLSSPALRFLPVLLALTVAGCFPYSCNRIESRVLFPQDSTSRAYSATLPVDTLIVAEQPEWSEMEYPRTVAYAPDGTLWFSDTGRHEVQYLTADGESGVISTDSLQYPYLAGFRGANPVVFSPAASLLAEVRGGWTLQTPQDVPPRALQYAAMDSGSVWVKLAGEDFESRLIRYDLDGNEQSRTDLPDPYWRWAGALVLRSGEPISLSGYRPQIYRFTGGVIDSLSLFGFDSPMLPRSRGFLLGETGQPPLLTPSGVFVGDDYFALNIRPGWLRIDQFDADLRLVRSLVEPDPSFGQEFFPADLAVRREPDGTLVIAVAVSQPAPEVRIYRAGS